MGDGRNWEGAFVSKPLEISLGSWIHPLGLLK
jgi:hypothetical protein